MREHAPTSRRTRRLVVGAAVALAGALAVWALPSMGDEPPAYSAFNGQQTYKTLCANCHGLKADGDGYLRESLLTKPTDLTTLAERHGGEFPAELVWAYIDGREHVREHGRREMPIWGDALLWPEEESAERRAHVKRKIGELVEFLRSIQDPAAPPPAAPTPPAGS